jgi:hypothetical protein
MMYHLPVQRMSSNTRHISIQTAVNVSTSGLQTVVRTLL